MSCSERFGWHTESHGTRTCITCSARVIVDRDTGRPKGFGFINMAGQVALSWRSIKCPAQLSIPGFGMLTVFADPTSARNAMAAMDGSSGLSSNRPLVVRPAGTGAAL